MKWEKTPAKTWECTFYGGTFRIEQLQNDRFRLSLKPQMMRAFRPLKGSYATVAAAPNAELHA